MISPVPPPSPPADDVDPIDWRFDAARPRTRTASRWRLRSTAALGLSPAPRPGLLLLLVGTALGADGLGLLTATVLSHLDPVLSVALAALGVVIGFGLDMRRPRERVLLAAASQQAGMTILLVAGGVLVIHSFWPALGAASWWLALMLGICASSSSTEATDVRDELSSTAIRIGDLDDVLPIVLGGLMLAWARSTATAPALSLTLQTGLIALVIAVAGWLLVTQASSESEQRVFAIGALLLLGGAAAYLSMSALLTGLVAGAFWNAVGGPIRERIGRDVRALQHPLIVLLLLMAGARLRISMEVLALATLYVVCRAIGKLTGGWLAHRMVSREVPGNLGRRLVSPGVIAIAFALNAVQASPTVATATLLAVVVIGSLASELLSLLVSPHEVAA